MGLHQFKGFYINVSYTTNCMLHIFSYYWPLIHYSVSVYINLMAYGFDFYFWRVWLSKQVQQKNLYVHTLTTLHILSILRENRQTYVSKTANTNKMTKKRKLIATTATWSTFPSASWSRTPLSATKQNNNLNGKLSFFHTTTNYKR